jgi:hypothetical protein
LQYNSGSRPNGRVSTARFFWAIVFEWADLEWRYSKLWSKP